MMRLFDDPDAYVHPLQGMDDEARAFEMLGLGPSEDWALGLTDDEARSEFESVMAPPTVSAWKQSTDRRVFVSVDQARDDITKQADAEFDHLIERMVELEVVPDPNETTMNRQELYDRLAEWSFGPNSLIFRLFEEKVPYVKNDHALFARSGQHYSQFSYSLRFCPKSLAKARNIPSVAMSLKFRTPNNYSRSATTSIQWNVVLAWLQFMKMEW
jgi:hypothetical protein